MLPSARDLLLCLAVVALLLGVLQDYQADADADNAALSRMRNALVNELDEAQQAEGR